MSACHSDLLTYAETAGVKLWNTEFGGLLTSTQAQAADYTAGMVLWMRAQPWVERWFLFIAHSDRNGSWPVVELLDANGNPTQLGKAYRDLTLLPATAPFYHYSYSAPFAQAPAYTRPGWQTNTSILEALDAPGYRVSLGARSYTAGTMRGRQFAAGGPLIYRVRFNYQTNYQANQCSFAMDTPMQLGKWESTVSGTSSDYVEVDLSDTPVAYVAFGLYVKESHYDAGTSSGLVSNLMLLTLHQGDMNCDGRVDFADVDAFVQALVSPEIYRAHQPACPWLNADCNRDGVVNFDDINPFAGLLVGSGG